MSCFGDRLEEKVLLQSHKSWVGGGCGNTGVALASPSHSCEVPVYFLADASFTVMFSDKK